MTISNYDQEIERKYHPENFEDEITHADKQLATPRVKRALKWFNKGLKKVEQH